MTSDLLPSAQDADKSSDINDELTPQQEAQPPTVAPPYPIPPHLMMHPQRYMMPMPMFYGPGFYPHSFPGMPGLPGMPGMMMSPYGHHVMPPMPQQQQPPPPVTGQPEQSLESLEETSSTTTSVSTTKLSPPIPPPSTIIPNQPPPPISVSSTSIELESSSSTSVNHQSVPMVDGVQALHVTAFQAEDMVPEDSQSLPLLSINTTVEDREGEVLQPTGLISTMLEDQHQQVQQENDGQQLGSAAFIPSTTAAAVEQQVGDNQIQSEEKMPPTMEIDVNISNPGQCGITDCRYLLFHNPIPIQACLAEEV